MYAKLQWHTEGQRAFLIEPDGSTYCEIVTLEGACPPAAVAQELTHAVNAGVGLLEALKSVLPLLEASYLDHEGTDNGAAVFAGLEAAREAIANAEGVTKKPVTFRAARVEGKGWTVEKVTGSKRTGRVIERAPGFENHETYTLAQAQVAAESARRDFAKWGEL